MIKIVVCVRRFKRLVSDYLLQVKFSLAVSTNQTLSQWDYCLKSSVKCKQVVVKVPWTAMGYKTTRFQTQPQLRKFLPAQEQLNPPSCSLKSAQMAWQWPRIVLNSCQTAFKFHLSSPPALSAWLKMEQHIVLKESRRLPKELGIVSHKSWNLCLNFLTSILKVITVIWCVKQSQTTMNPSMVEDPIRMPLLQFYKHSVRPVIRLDFIYHKKKLA